MEWTAVSLCPTPTVSTKTESNPAASHRIIVSRVLRATPPKEPAEGEGRMNASFSFANVSIRVLSPKILPFERSLLGSMASTASLWPCLSRCIPNTSIDVLFPAPGTPVMPIRMDFPANGRQRSMISCAICWCSCLALSTKVTAWLSIVIFPFRIPSTNSETVYCCRLILFFK